MEKIGLNNTLRPGCWDNRPPPSATGKPEFGAGSQSWRALLLLDCVSKECCGAWRYQEVENG